ncbi:hypothetical protein [Streptomyces sp. NPDC047108]|uniref:hypothetical protein n=1 Tax=Streptomyces sp. NPDC047108 TaxID=3155025 RepID=UPI0033FC7F81
MSAVTGGRLFAAGDPHAAVNHVRLVRDATRVPRYPEFVWRRGTTATHDRHRRYRAATVGHGQLRILRTTWRDGVPHREVCLRHPRRRPARGMPDPLPRAPLPGAVPYDAPKAPAAAGRRPEAVSLPEE